MPSYTEDVAVVFPVGGMTVLSITRIPFMDEALGASSPKLLFVIFSNFFWAKKKICHLSSLNRPTQTVSDSVADQHRP